MVAEITPNTNYLLLVTGLSGAGKSTALKTLEDLGWEAVDNFPIRLAGPLLALPSPDAGPAPPLAIGFDSRTRGFDPAKLIQQVSWLRTQKNMQVITLFLDCVGTEIERRYAETRRRHPLARDKEAKDGIAMEKAIMAPLRDWADIKIDTTALSANDLQTEIREQFRTVHATATHISISSFGYSRGIPHNADLVFDMRFLRNPHWDDTLRPLTGLDAGVGAYVSADPEYEASLSRIYGLILHLLPLYISQGKAYVNIAFGCTGGRHRSVFCAEQCKEWLYTAGYNTDIQHRNLTAQPIDALEGPHMAFIPKTGNKGII